MCDNSVVTKAVPEIWDYSVTVKTNTDGSRGMSAAVIVDSDSKIKIKKPTHSISNLPSHASTLKSSNSKTRLISIQVIAEAEHN